MVLSNKKLKQKLREAKVESLAAAESGEAEGKQSSLNPEGNSRLQVLLEAAKQKGRLSKREKRRKNTDNKSVNGDNDGETKLIEEEKKEGLVGEDDQGKNSEENKKKGKRKREEGESEQKGLKKAKQKKNKKKKKKKAKTVEEKVGVGAQVVADESKVISQSDKIEHVAAKVYVGGIPYYSTEDDIRSYFESCGTITEVDCMKFPDSGKFRGIAIISFKTEAAAKRALALDGSDMGGFYLKIQPCKTTRANKVSDFAPQIVEGYNRIYIGNLSYDITEDDLRKFFSDCKISSIRWGVDKETGEFRGYAHVDFSDNQSLLIALKFDQTILYGRPAKISCAVPLKGAKIHAMPAPKATSNEAAKEGLNRNSSAPTATEKEADNGGDASSGKIRRRICYECGEKGHISSACTKGAKIHESAVSTATNNETTSNILNKIDLAPAATEKEADNGGNASSGKIRRRTCYECGEKGHISSACPKRQMAETNSNAT